MTREEAIHELTEWREQMKSHGVPYWSAKLTALDMAIEALSADAVQGEWTHDGSMWENRWVCNKCGHKIFERQTNFCPNCGARMTPYKGGDSE